MVRPLVLPVSLVILSVFAPHSVAFDCDSYARTAVEQYRRAKQLKCSLAGPRWHGSRDLHFLWCTTQPASSARAEGNTRRKALRACKSGKTGNASAAKTFCKRSSAQYSGLARKIKRQCKNPNDHWDADPDKAFAACMSWPASNREANHDRYMHQLGEVLAICPKR